MANQAPDSRHHDLSLGHVRVGVVVGTHGNDGRLRIVPETDNPNRFAKSSTLTINEAHYTVTNVTRAAGGTVLIVNFKEISSREQAAALNKHLVLVQIDDTPALPEGTYYHYQLLGMTVVDSSGAELGTITEVLNTGANDVYVITTDKSELIIPALGNVIIEVDVTNARMTIDVPRGIEARSTTPKPKNKPVRRRFSRPKRPPSAPPASA